MQDMFQTNDVSIFAHGGHCVNNRWTAWTAERVCAQRSAGAGAVHVIWLQEVGPTAAKTS